MIDTKPEVRYIALPKGETLELEILPGFLDKVRHHFGLSPQEDVSDDYLRMFVFGAFKTAIDKAERETVNNVKKSST